MASYLITGAATGIGRALAQRLATPGTVLHLHTRSNQTGLEHIATGCRAAGAEVRIYVADLAEAPACHDLCEKITGAGAALDGFVNNAGFVDWRGLEQLQNQDFNYSLEAMTGAFFRLAQGLAPALRQSDGAAVVIVSSFVAHQFRFGRTFMPASAAAKAGLEATAKALASELANDGITVNGVVPGYIEKDQGHSRPPAGQSLDERAERTPLRRLGQPEEVAALIAFLLSDQARFITGEMIHIDGGLNLW